MGQGLARRAFWALPRCPGRKQPELLSGSKCVVKLSEGREEVAWGEKQEPWCRGLCPAVLTSKGGSTGYPLSLFFFFNLSYGHGDTCLTRRPEQYDSGVL